MVELGWERVPYSTGWEGAVADLGGNASHASWVGRCKPRQGGGASPQGSWIIEINGCPKILLGFSIEIDGSPKVFLSF